MSCDTSVVSMTRQMPMRRDNTDVGVLNGSALAPFLIREATPRRRTMIKIAALVFLLALLIVPTTMAQLATSSPDQGGIVERIDESGNVVVLQGGRMYRITPGTVLYVNNQPVAFSSLRPGQTVGV